MNKYSTNIFNFQTSDGTLLSSHRLLNLLDNRSCGIHKTYNELNAVAVLTIMTHRLQNVHQRSAVFSNRTRRK